MNEDAGTPGEQPEEERMVPLSPRQQDLYDFIRGYIARAGIAPSRGEISVALGTRSPSAGEQHLAALKKKGWIEIIPNTQRGIVLIGTGQVPLLYVDAAYRETDAARPHARCRGPDPGSAREPLPATTGFLPRTGALWHGRRRLSKR